MRIIILLTIFLASLQAQIAVSILDFTGEDVSDKLLRACYQKLETSLIESNQYTVIAKNQREEILKEMKFQNSGVCDEECAVEIGQLVGAEYLMLGDIIGFADLYQINIKIVNIEKGDVVEKVTKEIKGNLSDLLNGMEEASREITRKIASGGVLIIPQQSGMEVAQKKYGSMIIESTPSRATVLIDNVKRGSTPLELNNIEVGTRELQLIKTGYITINKGVIINEETPVNVSEVFILKSGDLAITSEPTGAMVYINGVIKGKTPNTITELAIGDYNVTVSSENYYDKTERVIVEYDRKNIKNIILQPKPGTVTIITTPQEAKITVGDKEYIANADGIASIELPAGLHKVDFSSNGYESVTKNITLSANENISLEVQMYLSLTNSPKTNNRIKLDDLKKTAQDNPKVETDYSTSKYTTVLKQYNNRKSHNYGLFIGGIATENRLAINSNIRIYKNLGMGIIISGNNTTSGHSVTNYLPYISIEPKNYSEFWSSSFLLGLTYAKIDLQSEGIDFLYDNSSFMAYSLNLRVGFIGMSFLAGIIENIYISDHIDGISEISNTIYEFFPGLSFNYYLY